MKLSLIIISVCISFAANAQELFVFTEPASNMPKNSIAIRVTNKLMTPYDKGKVYRVEPEVMMGVSRKIMVHLAGYGSNIFNDHFKMDGASIYLKYRFFSDDGIHAHFRMAAFAKASLINEPMYRSKTDDIDLDGNNSGWQFGIVATKLVNKLALSSSISGNALSNIYNNPVVYDRPKNAFNYSLSVGYLLFPKEYVSYKQTNVNVMAEYLGQQLSNGKGGYNEICPSVQFIFNSIARLDIGAKFPVWSTANRMFNNTYLLRLEYNFLNVFKSK